MKENLYQPPATFVVELEGDKVFAASGDPQVNGNGINSASSEDYGEF